MLTDHWGGSGEAGQSTGLAQEPWRGLGPALFVEGGTKVASPGASGLDLVTLVSWRVWAGLGDPGVMDCVWAGLGDLGVMDCLWVVLANPGVMDCLWAGFGDPGVMDGVWAGFRDPGVMECLGRVWSGLTNPRVMEDLG